MSKFIKIPAFLILTAVIAAFGFTGCGGVSGTPPDFSGFIPASDRPEQSSGQPEENPRDGTIPADGTDGGDNNIIDSDGKTRLKFIAAGDNIVHAVMLDDAMAKAKDDEIFNFGDIYKNISHIIKAADIALVNAETPIAGSEFGYSGYPMFNTPKENAFALVEAGFNIVSIANNHMLDKWEKGYENQLDFWDTQPVLQLGGFRNRQDFETVRIYEKDGVSIAFLSYTYGANGMYLPEESEMVAPFIDYATVERQVKAARPLADLLFVVMHWGDEDVFNANQTQKNLAEMMAANGVDVIIGMHPHVLQETVWLERSDGKKTLVTYSLGNLISGMLGAKNMVGGLLEFDIVKDGDTGTEIENVKIIPVITHYRYQQGRTGLYLPVYRFQNGRLDFSVYSFEDYTRELAAEHGVALFDSAFSYDYIKSLILQHIPGEFLSDFYRD